MCFLICIMVNNLVHVNQLQYYRRIYHMILVGHGGGPVHCFLAEELMMLFG